MKPLNMMIDADLTDLEKFIIASITIKKQEQTFLSEEMQVLLIAEYAKGLKHFNKAETLIKMVEELGQLEDFLGCLNIGAPAHLNNDVTDLTQREKFVFYSVELMFCRSLPLEIYIMITEQIKELFSVSNYQNILELVQNQINESLEFVKYASEKI
jgi:hypothetical protein